MIVEVAVEGSTDEPIARRLLGVVGLEIGAVRVLGGKDKLDANLRGYAAAATHAPHFVLRDLDDDEACPGALVGRLIPGPRSRRFAFRLAVREIEAWLLGDAQRFAAMFRVSRGKVPRDPELLHKPKRTLVDLVRMSTKPAIVKAMVPAPGESRQVGPQYVSLVAEFAMKQWRPEIARRSCPSLDRCLRALARLASDS
jgi:hypothetical protein